MKNFAGTTHRFPLFWIIILFITLPVLAFPELIFGRQTLYLTDLTWVHYPCRQFAAAEWLAGRAPLWDPYQHLGTPLLADTQVSPLYPPTALFLLPLSPALELSLYILSHFSLAAVFTLILARSLGMGRPEAVLAGLAYGFGGFLMAQVPNLTIMTGASWLPLVLYGLIQATRRRSWPIALLAGGPVALQILAAQPQIALYSLLTAAGYALYRIAVDFLDRASPYRYQIGYALRTGLLVTVVMGSGLLLAAPQLLPTLELQQLSHRAQERGLDFLTHNSLPPAQWLNLLLPSAFGNNVTGFTGDPFQEDFVYIGLIPLVLVFFSWQQRHRRDLIFFYLLLIAAALLAMGRYTPLYRYIIQYLPLFSLFRIPARWLMVINLALAILAGFGLETVRRRGLSGRTLAGLLAAGLLLGLAVVVIWSFQVELLRWSQTLAGSWQKPISDLLTKGFTLHPVYRERLGLRQLTLLTTPAFLLLVNLAVATLLFSLLATRRVGSGRFALLVILATAFDLALAGGTTINPIRPVEFWQQQSGGARFVLDNLVEGRVLPLGASREDLAVSHLGHCFPSVHRLPSASGFGSPLRLSRYQSFLKEAHPVQALQVTGVRYLLTPAYLGDDVAATYPIAFSDESSLVYENKAPLPRAFVVHEAIWAEVPETALAYFQDLALDPGRTVVLEADTPPPALPASPSGPASPAAIISEHAQAVEIAVDAGAAGYLVLLDSYYPGWRATIDGNPTPIYRANAIVRAVHVPPGRHVVQFAYRPASFRLGLALAGLMLVVIAVVFLVVPNYAWRRSS